MGTNAKGLSWKGYEGQDYENFWTGPGRKFLDGLERALITHCLPGGEAVVEIGAGFGRLGTCYVNRYRASYMVEPASNLRNIAEKTFGPAVTYWDASVYELPFPDATFDAVVMVRVFHHLEDSDKAIREIYRVLKPGGRIVFNYSNKRNFKRIIQYCFGKCPNPFELGPINYYPALIGHHPDDVEATVTKAGFKISAQFGVGITDKIVEAIPVLGYVLRPSVFLSRLVGYFRLAPTHFIVGIK